MNCLVKKQKKLKLQKNSTSLYQKIQQNVTSKNLKTTGVVEVCLLWHREQKWKVLGWGKNGKNGYTRYLLSSSRTEPPGVKVSGSEEGNGIPDKYKKKFKKKGANPLILKKSQLLFIIRDIEERDRTLSKTKPRETWC